MSARTAMVEPSAAPNVLNMMTLAHYHRTRALAGTTAELDKFVRDHIKELLVSVVAVKESFDGGVLLIYGDQLDEYRRKFAAKWQARMALKGYELIVHDNGTFSATRWGLLSKPLESLDAVADFARKVGA